MDYNPFTARLRTSEGEIAKLEYLRADLVEELTWVARFDPETEASELARLRSDLDGRGAEVRRLEAEAKELAATVRNLDSQSHTLESNARLGLNVFRWFSPEYDRAQARLAAHKREFQRSSVRLREADQKRDEATRELDQLVEIVMDKERALARFIAFSSGDTESEIARIDLELPPLVNQREDLKIREGEIERAIEGPMEELRRSESEIEEREASISRLRSENRRLQNEIHEVEDLSQQISSASNTYEQAMLHQDCERRFGHRSPGAAIRAIRSQLRSHEGEIRVHEGKIRSILSARPLFGLVRGTLVTK